MIVSIIICVTENTYIFLIMLWLISLAIIIKHNFGLVLLVMIM